VTDQNKERNSDSHKGQPASNAVAVNQTKKGETNTQKEQSATNTISAEPGKERGS
jgi:hypothetical protein